MFAMFVRPSNDINKLVEPKRGSEPNDSYTPDTRQLCNLYIHTLNLCTHNTGCYLGAKTLSLLIVELLDHLKFVATELIYPIHMQVYRPRALKYFSVPVKLVDMKDLRCTSFALGMKLWKV